MGKNYKDMFELPQLLDNNDPMRAIPSLDLETIELFGSTTMESVVSEDKKYMSFWDKNEALKLFPVHYCIGKNDIFLTPLESGVFKVELRFDLGKNNHWHHSFETEVRPNIPMLKEMFEHKFTEVGLKWPKWHWA